VGTGEGISAFASASGSLAWESPGAVAAPNFDRLFSLAGPDRSPTLVSLDPSSGKRAEAMRVPTGFSVRVASPSGRSVALVEGRGTGSTYAPAARSHTRIVVARPHQGQLRAYELAGNFEPEAFSTDDRSLFMIEYLPGTQLGRYRVRMMRLASGRVLPVGRLTKTAPDSMRGTGRVQVYSPGADVLYTLYTRQPPNDAHRPLEEIHHKGMVHAFVHVLNLEEGWAHCVDLPMPFGMGSDPAGVLAISPYGRFLYAGDGERIAVVDTDELRVQRVQQAGRFDDVAAAVSVDDRLYLGSGASVDVLDALTLEPLKQLPAPGIIRALGLSADGSELFVAGERAVTVLDTVSGDRIEKLSAEGANQIFYREVTGRLR
jgi:hypothetical protein